MKFKLNDRVIYLSGDWIINKMNDVGVVLVSPCRKFTKTVKPKHYEYIYKADRTYPNEKKFQYGYI